MSKVSLLWGPPLVLLPVLQARVQLCWLCLNSQDTVSFSCYFQVVSQLYLHAFKYYPWPANVETVKHLYLSFQPAALCLVSCPELSECHLSYLFFRAQ